MVSPSACEKIKKHPEFVPIEKYDVLERPYKGEIGKLYGMPIVKTAYEPINPFVEKEDDKQ